MNAVPLHVKLLVALRAWEPLRDRDRRLRIAIDQPGLNDAARITAEHAWRESRAESEVYFARITEALVELDLLAPRSVREVASRLFVESSGTGQTGRLMEEFRHAVRLDLGTDTDPRQTGSPLLDDPRAFAANTPGEQRNSS